MTDEEKMSKELYESLDNIYRYFRDKRTWTHEDTLIVLEECSMDVIHTLDMRYSKKRGK